MSILYDFRNPFRTLCMAIDSVIFSLLDNSYNLFIELASAEFLTHDTIETMMKSLYILFGIVAFFRLAVVLVNSIIDPDKLNEKGKGLSNIFFRVVAMIVILAVTPMLFNFSYEIQKMIVGKDNKITGEGIDNNVIFQVFLGENANLGSGSEYDGGKALKNIVLSTLITIDDRYLVNNGAVCTYDEEGNVKDSSGNIVDITDESQTSCGFVPATCVGEGDTCTMQGGYIYDGNTCTWANCKNAVETYNQMYVNENMNLALLSPYAGADKKLPILDSNGKETEEKDTVYVLNYMYIITAIIGIAMIWILISFTIDIAVRIFELIVLEITAPLFIATFVDPKSSQSGPFKNWLTNVGKSYASLYIKLIIFALMTLFIMLLNQTEMFNDMGDLSGWAKLFVVIGILIFAKKAPKWISEMLGIKGDESGLGGLSIGKKLGGMALAGGLINKARDGIKGGLKKQGDKMVDHGKKRLSNLGNKALGSYAARKYVGDEAKKAYKNSLGLRNGQKMTLSQRINANKAAMKDAFSSDANAKAKATRAQIQADFVANNDLRAFAGLKDKYSGYAQNVNPFYKSKREQQLDKVNTKAQGLLKKASMDSDTMEKARKNAKDISKAISIYGEDFVRQHIRDDGSLDKSYCPLNEGQINNEYAKVLGHDPQSLRDIAKAQLSISGIEYPTEKQIEAKVNSFDAYPKALYQSAVFENGCSNQSNYISSLEGASKANKELTELYSQRETFINNYTGDRDSVDYENAIARFESLIKNKTEDVIYYEGEIKNSKDKFVNTFGGALDFDTDGKIVTKSNISKGDITANDSIVEINGEYVTKFGKFIQESDGSYKFVQQDMSQLLSSIDKEQESKRNGKIANALEAAKPAELKAAEKKGE